MIEASLKEVFYRNGKLKGIGQKLNGKNHGLFIYYDEDGKVSKKVKY